MARQSKIEWTGPTWNIAKGCSRVGPECDNCYAMNMARRFEWGRHLTRRHTVKLKVIGDGPRRQVDDMVDWTGAVELHPDLLSEPLRWQQPDKVFVCSGSDLFHPKVPFEFIAAAFGVMATAERHTFQLLTKRAARMAEFFRWLEQQDLSPSQEVRWRAMSHFSDRKEKRFADQVEEHPCSPWPLPNVWCGTSVGVREAKPRIDDLREVPAAVRFLSLEPLLEDLGELDLRGIGWVIAGGESGSRARPMHPDWARSIRDQCDAADVPFFYKQHGRFGPADQLDGCRGRRHTFDDGQEVVGVGKKKAGRELDGRLHDAMPAVA